MDLQALEQRIVQLERQVGPTVCHNCRYKLYNGDDQDLCLGGIPPDTQWQLWVENLPLSTVTTLCREKNTGHCTDFQPNAQDLVNGLSKSLGETLKDYLAYPAYPGEQEGA